MIVGLNSHLPFDHLKACFCLYFLFICLFTETDSTFDMIIKTVKMIYRKTN